MQDRDYTIKMRIFAKAITLTVFHVTLLKHTHHEEAFIYCSRFCIVFSVHYY